MVCQLQSERTRKKEVLSRFRKTARVGADVTTVWHTVPEAAIGDWKYSVADSRVRRISSSDDDDERSRRRLE